MVTASDTCDGYRHEAVVYGSDDAFLDALVPFVTDAVGAGEPILLGLTDVNLDLLAGECDLSHELITVDGADYANPVQTIHEWLRRFQRLIDSGVTSMRAIGEVPHPGISADWHSWARYEAVINRAFADVPLWSLCPYDSRITPEHVLGDVARTHPFLTDGHDGAADHDAAVNSVYEDPEDFFSRFPARPGMSDLRPPDVTLRDPTPREARRHLEALVAHLSLRPEVMLDLHVAVSELVSNARHHGEGPVSTSFWIGPDRIEITVNDRGTGPADPLAGWIPPEDALATGGGRGLWLTYQLSPVLDVWTDAEQGFTARVSVSA